MGKRPVTAAALLLISLIAYSRQNRQSTADWGCPPAPVPPVAVEAPNPQPLIVATSTNPTPKADRTAATANAAISDDTIRQEIIRESLASYGGSCPCPYNTDRAGHSCGRRSAYSRPGGAAPLCFDVDVTDEMVRGYRASHH